MNLYIVVTLGHNQLAVIQRWSAYTVEPVYLETQPVGCYTEVTCSYSEPVYSGHLGTQPLAVIQRWPAYTVKPVYSGHPWDTTSWLLYRGDLLIQWNLYIVVTLGTQPLAVIQRWPAYTVKPVYSGHPWDTTSWLLYRGDLLIQWNLYNRVVTLGT